MRSSKALGNHDNNSTMTIDSLLGIFVKWREAKRFLVSILIDTWRLSVSLSVNINRPRRKYALGLKSIKKENHQVSTPFHTISHQNTGETHLPIT